MTKGDPLAASRDESRRRAAAWLRQPGQPGAMGALLDEYARAAEDFCRVVEGLGPARFEQRHPQARDPGPRDPDTRTPRSICAHVVRAAWAYAADIRRRRGLPESPSAADGPAPGGSAGSATPSGVRSLLRDALHWTEGAVEGLQHATEAEIEALSFPVRWGPTYDPDMLLEHAICHLLRHRRQLERWPD